MSWGGCLLPIIQITWRDGSKSMVPFFLWLMVAGMNVNLPPMAWSSPGYPGETANAHPSASKVLKTMMDRMFYGLWGELLTEEGHRIVPCQQGCLRSDAQCRLMDLVVLSRRGKLEDCEDEECHYVRSEGSCSRAKNPYKLLAHGATKLLYFWSFKLRCQRDSLSPQLPKPLDLRCKMLTKPCLWAWKVKILMQSRRNWSLTLGRNGFELHQICLTDFLFFSVQSVPNVYNRFFWASSHQIRNWCRLGPMIKRCATVAA